MSDFRKDYLRRMEEAKQEMLSENLGLINDFIKFCQTKNTNLSLENFDYIPTIGIMAKCPNLVGLLNENIQNDKEGLASISDLEKEYSKQAFMSGYYYSDKYMVMAHPYFRRAYHENSNYAPRFVELFWKFNKPQQETFIAIDRNRVRINVDNRMYMEHDTWFGAKFQNSISDIDEGIVKLRPPFGLEPFDIDFFFGNAYSLDIKWSSKNGIKVFQAEEFKAETTKIIHQEQEYFPVKYLHAEFDLTSKSFRHFDGAIHFYTEEEYYQRRDQDFNYNNKHNRKLKSLSQKLFKINGQLETKDWIEFTSHFLTGDPLIFEYFEGKLPDHTIETVKIILANREKNTE